MSDNHDTVRLTQVHDYQFDTDFGLGQPALRGDLPPPLGGGAGPSPEHLLLAAVGNCLSSSLLFSLRKFKQAPEPISAELSAEVGRNADNRLRVLQIDAKLTLGVPAASLQHLDRVLGSFESFCTVTQSIVQGIPVRLSVFDSTGAKLR
jgi:uncharacterized OsmC-like protein